ncbi:MAG TPA: DNA starvation/stationary phase protection protein [Planctomycetota bacterium]|jgi:starvation-inducible DNA-binding protein|nr:DNA starvation/stationary phase protection protein [Planctomycetota bacterium]
MKPNLGLSDALRNDVVGILNTLLADEFLLYTKTRNYHWNVVGHQFHDLHKFFEAQYEALDEIVDEVAERARSLGGPSAGTLKEFLGATRLKESPGETPDARGMVGNLLADHEAVVRSLRADLEACTKLGDAGTTDFLTGLMERHEKTAWMLRATLEGK